MARRREIERLIVETVVVGPRARPLDEAQVSALARSMKEIGLQSPIAVRAAENVEVPGEGVVDGAYVLVYGLHRLEAARKLGWETIDGWVIEGSEIDAQIAEIDENLVRAELTTDEKAVHMARRMELWKQREKENRVAHDAPPEIGYRKPPPQKKGFAADTAAATGLSKSQINRLVARGKELLDPTPKPRPAPLPERSAKEDWLTKMFALWAHAEPEWHEDFLSQIDTPVFDSTRAA